MSFDKTPTEFEKENNTSIPQIEQTTDEVKTGVQSLLGLYKLDFDFQRDIHDEILADYFGVGNIFLYNFEENGCGSAMRFITMDSMQVEMGTGFLLVTDEYISLRGEKQRIYLADESYIIGRTSFIDGKGMKQGTNIYFIGPGTNEIGGSIGIAYSQDDIYDFLQEMHDK